jgi:hypothetical protein
MITLKLFLNNFILLSHELLGQSSEAHSRRQGTSGSLSYGPHQETKLKESARELQDAAV